MNRNQQTTLLNLATVATLALVPTAGYFLWMDEAAIVSPKRDRSIASVVSIPQPIETEFDSYYAKYWFQQPAVPQPKETTRTSKPVAKIPPPTFQVVAMVVSSQAEESLITVRANNAASVLRIGQTKDGYTLKKIDPDGNAQFERDGQSFSLKVIDP